MSDSQKNLDDICVNTIRLLAADAIQQANSGHPGLPLGAAPMAYVLWTRFLKHNPANPGWVDRDRFVLSAGHGSGLLYALLHLTGYDLSLDEVKRFRQWGSKTPGHPERDPAVGIECTTGPLGQGFAMGVGMAMAERFLSSRFNRPDFPIMDHFTYAIVSDGDLMEGIASEAASIAGHLKLGKLIYLYDDNHISIEGDTAITFTEDPRARFDAYGWHTQAISDGNNLEDIANAIQRAREETERPSLIAIRTHLGYGSPKQDSPSAHGEPLGEEGLRSTKEFFGWDPDQRFHVPDEALAYFRKAVGQGKDSEEKWRALFMSYAGKYKAEAEDFERELSGELPSSWDTDIPGFKPEDGPLATRAASGKVINAIAPRIANLLGGSADLAPSNKTLISDSQDFSSENPSGRNIRFGVREHSMGAIVNGMALHGGVIPYAGTFLVFADYMKPAIRLSALMNVHAVFIFTHDSLGVGEDGPTHQPIEHLASLRVIPNLIVFRPADANETAAAWRVALQQARPAALALSRQKLPILDPESVDIFDGVAKGAYVLSDAEGTPDILLVATGSEVSLVLEAQQRLSSDKGIRARVISMPCWELFEEQSTDYQNRIFPPELKARLAIEAGATMGWHRWIGDAGEVIGVNRFGASAPGSQVLKNYGFNIENVVERAEALVRRGQ
jgi:transketolase